MEVMRRPMRARQRGWVGLVVILVALVIVALLAKNALKQYGLAPDKATASKAATPGERARAPGAAGIEALDLDSAPTAPSGALDRARGVEDMVKRQADERATRMDGVK
jgi:hypothetical protein